NAVRKGEPSPLAPLSIQYVDYASWQRYRLESEALDAQLAYWREELSDLPPVLDLITDKPRSQERTYQGRILAVRLPEDLSEALRSLSRANGVTLYMTLLSAFAVLLSRYSAQDDIAIGTPIANRTRKDTEGIIG